MAPGCSPNSMSGDTVNIDCGSCWASLPWLSCLPDCASSRCRATTSSTCSGGARGARLCPTRRRRCPPSIWRRLRSCRTRVSTSFQFARPKATRKLAPLQRRPHSQSPCIFDVACSNCLPRRLPLKPVQSSSLHEGSRPQRTRDTITTR